MRLGQGSCTSGWARTALLGAALTWSRAAWADGPAWLTWQPPAECPSAEFIGDRVTELLGTPVSEDSDIEVVSELSWAAGRWEVTVDVRRGAQRGRRHVAVATCQEAADFVAVATVLAIDPAREQTGVTADNGTAPAASSPDRTSPAETVQDPAISRAAPTPSQEDQLRTASTSELGVRNRARGYLGGSALVMSGALPGVRVGTALSGGVQIRSLRLDLEAGWLPSAAVTSEQARAPIAFSLFAGRLGVSYSWQNDVASIGPVLALHGGAIRSRQRISGAETRWGPWWALGLGAAGAIHLGRWVELTGGGEVLAPLGRRRFLLDDGSLVHRVGWGGRITLGLRLFFTPR